MGESAMSALLFLLVQSWRCYPSMVRGPCLSLLSDLPCCHLQRLSAGEHVWSRYSRSYSYPPLNRASLFSSARLCARFPCRRPGLVRKSSNASRSQTPSLLRRAPPFLLSISPCSTGLHPRYIPGGLRYRTLYRPTFRRCESSSRPITLCPTPLLLSE